MSYFREQRMMLTLENFCKNRQFVTIERTFPPIFWDVLQAKLLKRLFIYAKSKTFKDIWNAFNFFKDLNINCVMMSLFSKTFKDLSWI